LGKDERERSRVKATGEIRGGGAREEGRSVWYLKSLGAHPPGQKTFGKENEARWARPSFWAGRHTPRPRRLTRPCRRGNGGHIRMCLRPRPQTHTCTPKFLSSAGAPFCVSKFTRDVNNPLRAAPLARPLSRKKTAIAQSARPVSLGPCRPNPDLWRASRPRITCLPFTFARALRVRGGRFGLERPD
jgi:hypothetical protein